MGIGQMLLALSVMMFSWGSMRNFHCNPARKWRQLCRLQGFFIVSGMHITITTSAIEIYFRAPLTLKQVANYVSAHMRVRVGPEPNQRCELHVPISVCSETLICSAKFSVGFMASYCTLCLWYLLESHAHILAPFQAYVLGFV